MRPCIICRQLKDTLSDEHVIPDAMNGYYHIHTVCLDCNNKLGSLVDSKLTNHKFVEFQRNILGVRGKRGSVPDPLKGTYPIKGNPDQKVMLRLNSNGRYEGKIKPSMSKIIAGEFTIFIDKKDESIKDHIINRFLRENGIDRQSVIMSETNTTKESPQLQASLTIDVEKFKMAILKIAYEFTVDQVPSYFNDPCAHTLSKILFDVNYDDLKNTVEFIGNGFDNGVLEPFSHLLDITNSNHYLILFDSDEQGLLCFVNLFNTFSIGIKMSANFGFINNNLIVLKNDLTSKKVEIFNTEQLINATYSAPSYRFQYLLPADQNAIDEFTMNERDPEFSFYAIQDQTPFFTSDGAIAFQDLNEKLSQNHLYRITKGDTIDSMVDEIIIDEELFIKHLPINRLYRVISVEISRHRTFKI